MDSQFNRDREIASSLGEIVPSLVKVRRFKGAYGYPPALGRYEARFEFTPFGGETLCVQPSDVEEAPDDWVQTVTEKR